MARTLPLTDDPTPEPLPVGPSAAEWATMSEGARESFVQDANAALEREKRSLGEGAPHTHARFSAWQTLRDHFKRAGRDVYLGTDQAVIYPGERVFEPDLYAVVGEPEPAVDTRMAWVVTREGRGVDLVLEVLHSGNRQKDLAGNVVDLARLGIPEYFVFDRLKLRLYGYRLPAPGARQYHPIAARAGLLHSEVLGLDLGLFEHRLRFSSAGAVIPETHELLERANAIVDQLEARASEATERAEAEARHASEATQRAEALAAKLRALGVDPDA